MKNWAANLAEMYKLVQAAGLLIDKGQALVYLVYTS